MSNWYVYMVRCADRSLYTGIATDIERRVTEHNESNKLGARYTRARRPVELVYSEPFDNRSDATRREAEIKKLPRPEKEKMLGKKRRRKKSRRKPVA